LIEVKEMSDSEAKKLLAYIAKKYDCKIWLTKRIGKRLAYISEMKAGEEKFLPANKVYERDDIVVFSEGLDTLNSEILEILEKVVQNFVDRKTGSKT